MRLKMQKYSVDIVKSLKGYDSVGLPKFLGILTFLVSWFLKDKLMEDSMQSVALRF